MAHPIHDTAAGVLPARAPNLDALMTGVSLTTGRATITAQAKVTRAVDELPHLVHSRDLLACELQQVADAGYEQ